MSRRERTEEGPNSIYFIAAGDFAVDDTPVKIGVAKDVQKRLKTLQTASSKPLNLAFSLEHDDPEQARRGEPILHLYFDSDFIRGEWFKASPRMRELADAFSRDPVSAWDIVDEHVEDK